MSKILAQYASPCELHYLTQASPLSRWVHEKEEFAPIKWRGDLKEEV